jgi:hypothetical protein
MDAITVVSKSVCNKWGGRQVDIIWGYINVTYTYNAYVTPMIHLKNHQMSILQVRAVRWSNDISTLSPWPSRHLTWRLPEDIFPINQLEFTSLRSFPKMGLPPNHPAGQVDLKWTMQVLGYPMTRETSSSLAKNQWYPQFRFSPMTPC